jgi:hypothetical protein
MFSSKSNGEFRPASVRTCPEHGRDVRQVDRMAACAADGIPRSHERTPCPNVICSAIPYSSDKATRRPLEVLAPTAREAAIHPDERSAKAKIGDLLRHAAKKLESRCSKSSQVRRTMTKSQSRHEF